MRLARRAAELSSHIEATIDPDPQAIDESLETILMEFLAYVLSHSEGCFINPMLNIRLLARIRRDVENQLRRKPLDRFFHKASIASALDDHQDALDSAWRSFDVRTPRDMQGSNADS